MRGIPPYPTIPAHNTRNPRKLIAANNTLIITEAINQLLVDITNHAIYEQ